MVPIVELLADCQSDAARASWLLTVPQGVVLRDHAAIRAVLREAGFQLGVDCLELEFSALHATRLADGGLPHTVVLGVQAARSFLRAVVRKGGAA
jgi:hypothetical protein